MTTLEIYDSTFDAQQKDAALVFNVSRCFEVRLWHRALDATVRRDGAAFVWRLVADALKPLVWLAMPGHDPEAAPR